MTQRDLVDGVATPARAVLMLARADGDDDAPVLARAEDRVLRVGRAMDEVPLPQRPLLAFHDEKRLALDDEEVLLVGLPVVHRHRLAWPQALDVDSDLSPVLVALEVAERAAPFDVVPARVAGTQHEPAVPGRNEPVLGLLELRFRNHAVSLPDRAAPRNE